MSAICPECDSAVDVDQYDVDIGDELTCSECGSLLRVASDSPLELEVADEDDDLEDEEESTEEDAAAGDDAEDGDEEEEDEDDLVDEDE
jgi:alpha-aminoadipate carrier protein LysW